MSLRLELKDGARAGGERHAHPVGYGRRQLQAGKAVVTTQRTQPQSYLGHPRGMAVGAPACGVAAESCACLSGRRQIYLTLTVIRAWR